MLILITVLLVIRSGVVQLGDNVGERVREQLGQKQDQPPGNEPLVGERILQGYATTGTIPHEDLIRMAHLLNKLFELVRGDTPPPLGSNEEIAAALRGQNRAQLRFLPDTHPAFNALGQVVDRWGTPLFFYAASDDRLDIRSAGPDKMMWTEDDLHRTHDGRFLRGAELNADSLLETLKSHR